VCPAAASFTYRLAWSSDMPISFLACCFWVKVGAPLHSLILGLPVIASGIALYHSGGQNISIVGEHRQQAAANTTG